MKALILMTLLLTARWAGAQDLDVADLKRATASFEITEELIRNFAAFASEFNAIADSTPGLKDSMTWSGTLSLAQAVRHMESSAGIKKLIAKHNLTARDIVILPAAYMQAAMLAYAPPELLGHLADSAGANMDNLPLIREKGHELTPIMETAAGLLK